MLEPTCTYAAYLAYGLKRCAVSSNPCARKAKKIKKSPLGRASGRA